jgi:hypothetical protein
VIHEDGKREELNDLQEAYFCRRLNEDGERNADPKRERILKSYTIK